MQFLASVVILSCLYAMLACGFVIIYKSSRILNFSYSDFVMMTGYLCVTLTQNIGGPPVIALCIGIVVSFLFGLIVYMLLIKPMAGQPIFSTVILTVALGIVLHACTILIWGGKTENIPIGWRGYYSLMGGVRVSSTEIVLISTTFLFFIALFAFYRFSTLGQQMRATAENALLASQRGINIYMVTAFAWGISLFATGIGGILLGGNFSVSLHMGHVAIKAFAVALVGGLDSIGGAIPAAIIVAISELVASNYINSRLADAMPFMIMIVVLLIRPWGLLGTEEEIERV